MTYLYRITLGLVAGLACHLAIATKPSRPNIILIMSDGVAPRFTAFRVEAGEVLTIVQMATVTGLPHQ